MILQLVKLAIFAEFSLSRACDTSHYGKEGPFELPRGWSWTSLGAIAVDMADGPFGSNLKREHYTSNKEARIIQLSNIGEAGWREDNTKYTTFVHAETISRSIVSPGNLVIAKMMPAGRAIICPDVEKMYVLSSDAVKYVPSKEIFNKYLLYAINSPVVLNQIHAEVQGVTRARTSIEKLRGYLVPIPPKEEQRRIVNSIDYWLEIIGTIEHNQSFVSASIERIKAKILEYAIKGKLVSQDSRDEPAIDLLKRCIPAFEPSHNLHYEGNVPAGWATARLGDIVDIISGTSFQKTDMTSPGTGLKILRGGNIQNGHIVLCEDDVYISDTLINERSNVKRGDIVIVASTGSSELIGKAALSLQDYPRTQIGAFLRIIRPKSVELFDYLGIIFQSELYKKHIREIAKGTNINNIKASYITEFIIPIPPFEEQKRITKKVYSLFAILSSLNPE